MTVPRKMPTNYRVTAKIMELAVRWWHHRLDRQWIQPLYQWRHHQHSHCFHCFCCCMTLTCQIDL